MEQRHQQELYAAAPCERWEGRRDAEAALKGVGGIPPPPDHRPDPVTTKVAELRSEAAGAVRSRNAVEAQCAEPVLAKPY